MIIIRYSAACFTLIIFSFFSRKPTNSRVFRSSVIVEHLQLNLLNISSLTKQSTFKCLLVESYSIFLTPGYIILFVNHLTLEIIPNRFTRHVIVFGIPYFTVPITTTAVCIMSRVFLCMELLKKKIKKIAGLSYTNRIYVQILLYLYSRLAY